MPESDDGRRGAGATTTVGEHPPLTARQIVASTLLGVDPPRLPSRQLVESGALFGISEGAVRVALSRMARAGELVAEDGWYRLSGPLLTRQARQAEGRHPELLAWDGTWELWTVREGPRPAGERSQLRAAMRALRVAELREGVWTRPANLPSARLPGVRGTVADQTIAFRAEPVADATELASELWDLRGWAAGADRLQATMEEVGARLRLGAVDALRPGWELSAAVLRHLLADPLLPDDLLPATWPGAAVRATYDAYDLAFKRCWLAATSAGERGGADRGS